MNNFKIILILNSQSILEFNVQNKDNLNTNLTSQYITDSLTILFNKFTKESDIKFIEITNPNLFKDFSLIVCDNKEQNLVIDIDSISHYTVAKVPPKRKDLKTTSNLDTSKIML